MKIDELIERLEADATDVAYYYNALEMRDDILKAAETIRVLNAVPAADVAPIKRGNWRDDVVSFYRKCSECGCCVEWNKKPFLFGDGEYNYCPNCGAKMDGGQDDA